MRLEHLNLIVKDIPKALDFYQAAFPHWSVRTEGQGQWNGVDRNWVHFGDDYNFITFNDNGTGENRDLSKHSVGLAHFAFITANIDAVIERLEQAGYKPAKSGAENNYRKNIYYIDNDNYEIEFVQYLSDLPIERNNND